MSMRIDELNDLPEMFLTIGGREYAFSAIPLLDTAGLQAYLRRTIPNPVDRIKPYLEGLTPEERMSLIQEAKQEAQSWPPDIGTPEGKKALLASESGQYELIAAALAVHQPGLSRAQAERFYRELKRETIRVARRALAAGVPIDGEEALDRIYSVALGYGDPLLSVEEPIPEGSGPGRVASIGASCIEPASNGSR